MDLYVAIGRRIQAYRKINQLTQQELAEKASISLSFLGHIERGTRKLSVESLYKLANALDCSVDSLLSFTNNKRELKYSEILRIIADDYDRMGK